MSISGNLRAHSDCACMVTWLVPRQVWKGTIRTVRLGSLQTHRQVDTVMLIPGIIRNGKFGMTKLKILYGELCYANKMSFHRYIITINIDRAISQPQCVVYLCTFQVQCVVYHFTFWAQFVIHHFSSEIEQVIHRVFFFKSTATKLLTSTTNNCTYFRL